VSHLREKASLFVAPICHRNCPRHVSAGEGHGHRDSHPRQPSATRWPASRSASLFQCATVQKIGMLALLRQEGSAYSMASCRPVIKATRYSPFLKIPHEDPLGTCAGESSIDHSQSLDRLKTWICAITSERSCLELIGSCDRSVFEGPERIGLDEMSYKRHRSVRRAR
jgi:hypothetical protein